MQNIKQVSSKKEIIDNENDLNKFDVNKMANPSEILCNVVHIKKDLQEKNLEYVKEKYKEFGDKYPLVFKKITSGSDLNELFTMLKLMGQIKQGDLDFNTASEKIGYSMADKYLPENLKKKIHKNDDDDDDDDDDDNDNND